MKQARDYNNVTWVVAMVGLLISGSTVEADYVFGAPTLVPGGEGAMTPHISADGLSLYLAVPGENFSDPDNLNLDIAVMTRLGLNEPWSLPEMLGSNINGPAQERSPAVLSNGLELYFTSTAQGGYGSGDLYVATRTTFSDPWSPAQNLGANINTPAWESDICLTQDGLKMYFVTARSDPHGDIWTSSRASLEDPWQPPTDLGPPFSLADEGRGFNWITSDQRIASGSMWDFSKGDFELCLSKRPDPQSPWGELVPLPAPVNTLIDEVYPHLTPDGRSLYFTRLLFDYSGPVLETPAIWEVSITPVVDFDGSGIVDIADLLQLIDCWDQNEPSLDIGPTPFGDGTIDVNDLEVLIDYWGHEIVDPTLGPVEN